MGRDPMAGLVYATRTARRQSEGASSFVPREGHGGMAQTNAKKIGNGHRPPHRPRARAPARPMSARPPARPPTQQKRGAARIGGPSVRAPRVHIPLAPWVESVAGTSDPELRFSRSVAAPARACSFCSVAVSGGRPTLTEAVCLCRSRSQSWSGGGRRVVGCARVHARHSAPVRRRLVGVATTNVGVKGGWWPSGHLPAAELRARRRCMAMAAAGAASTVACRLAVRMIKRARVGVSTARKGKWRSASQRPRRFGLVRRSAMSRPVLLLGGHVWLLPASWAGRPCVRPCGHAAGRVCRWRSSICILPAGPDRRASHPRAHSLCPLHLAAARSDDATWYPPWPAVLHGHWFRSPGQRSLCEAEEISWRPRQLAVPTWIGSRDQRALLLLSYTTPGTDGCCRSSVLRRSSVLSYS
jgi:hypothetical protein